MEPDYKEFSLDQDQQRICQNDGITLSLPHWHPLAIPAIFCEMQPTWRNIRQTSARRGERFLKQDSCKQEEASNVFMGHFLAK
jgi:hypothetical protein